MSFAELERAITSPALKRVAQHWNEARGKKRMPGWSDIKPAAIAAQLSIVWAYRYDNQANDFIGRLSGDKIVEIFGKNLHGLPMREIYPPHDYPRLFARIKRVMTEPTLYRGQGVIFAHIDRHGIGERIIMPLGGDGVFGATEYEHRFSETAAGNGETDGWFTLD